MPSHISHERADDRRFLHERLAGPPTVRVTTPELIALVRFTLEHGRLSRPRRAYLTAQLAQLQGEQP